MFCHKTWILLYFTAKCGFKNCRICVKCNNSTGMKNFLFQIAYIFCDDRHSKMDSCCTIDDKARYVLMVSNGAPPLEILWRFSNKIHFRMLKTHTDGAPEDQQELRNQKLKTEKPKKKWIKNNNFCYQFSRISKTSNLQTFSD